MIVMAYTLSLVSLILNGFLFLRLKPPNRVRILWMPQLLAGTLSPFLVIVGGLGAILGWLAGAPLAVAIGVLGAGISAVYIWRVLAVRADFARVFGAGWQDRLPPPQKSRLLQRRWNLGLPPTPAPRWEQDIPFWTIPGTDRQLLCDVWQPPEGVAPSGLAFVYLHGSAWFLLDKDYGTRPFFRQLAAQGHVVMDVAYRLCPEVDLYGMIGDVKRAVAWMKTHAERYGVDPARVVLGGASAGGHLALLAAYAPDHPQLTPEDVQGTDLSVRAVVSYYGPIDLRTVYTHLGQEQLIDLPKLEIGLPGAADAKTNMQDVGRLDALLGGHPQEAPEAYDLGSPITHIDQSCPPTLLIQGDLDVITPVESATELERRLADCGVPVINIIYPLTNHAFDLLLPQFSPAAQASLYEVERFLALQV
jgi:acetyl esterase/lipase